MIISRILKSIGVVMAIAVSLNCPALADDFKPGQTIYFDYHGSIEEAKILGVDSSGLHIEAKNPLTHVYDGTNTRYIQPGEVKPAPAAAGGTKTSAGTGRPAPAAPATPRPAAAATPRPAAATSAAQTQSTPGATASGGAPRIGRYHVYGVQMRLVGWFDLKADGTYKTQAGGTGRYSLGGAGINWLSGPYKDQNFLGIVRIDRGGLTSRITLTKSPTGSDRMIAFCSADK